MKKKCNCWECCRGRGETPSMKGRYTVIEDSGIQRTVKPYQSAASNEKIPVNADLTGLDRPLNKKRRRKARELGVYV